MAKILKGTIMWGFFSDANGPHPLSNKYEFTLSRLNKESYETAKSIGLNPLKESKYDKSDPNFRGYYLVYRSQSPIFVYHDGEKVVETKAKLIGNGTKAEVETDTFTWAYPKPPSKPTRNGISASAKSVTLTDVVWFEPKKQDVEETLVTDEKVDDEFFEDAEEPSNDSEFEVVE